MFDTIHAEAAYHARIGGLPTDNPYESGTESHNAWDQGFMDGMIYIRHELKVTFGAYGKLVLKKREVEAKLAQLQAEYDAFLLEQGY